MTRREPIWDLLRLRRAQRRHPDDEDLRDVRTSLEHAAGPTVGRAAAARLLGVSQTALDRWIAAGEVSVVMTATGRWEVPLSPLLDLLEAVEKRRAAGSRRPLAAVLRDRRETVTASPPSRRRAASDGHRSAEAHGRAYHAAIADRLDDTMVADALARVSHWRSERRIHPRYADAWQQLLTGPRARLVDALRSDDDQAAALRQSSPFAGTLDERERRALLGLPERSAP